LKSDFIEEFTEEVSIKLINHVLCNRTKILSDIGKRYLKFYNLENRLPNEPVLTEKEFINKLNIIEFEIEENLCMGAFPTLYINTQGMLGGDCGLPVSISRNLELMI
jgi:hypothetical protein